MSRTSPATTIDRDAPGRAGTPELPEAARRHTMAGAEAFVRFFMDQLNRAWSQPQAGLISRLSMPGCKSCSAYEASAVTGTKSGKRLDGPAVSIDSIMVTSSTKKGVVLASMKQLVHRRRVLDKSGRVVGHTQKETFYSRAEVRWTTDGWRIQEVRELRP